MESQDYLNPNGSGDWASVLLSPEDFGSNNRLERKDSALREEFQYEST